jgi:eukaryotic-like serine/threonine-protein kinase
MGTIRTWITALWVAGFLLAFPGAPATPSQAARGKEMQKNNPKDGAALVYVPAGEFTMGNDEYSDGLPLHRVRISRGFWLYRTEVSNGQYGKFLRDTEHREPEYWNRGDFNHPEQPVIGVSWHDANAYCKWAGVRLPSEAEWEYAASGTDGRRYPWGNAAPTPEHAAYEGHEEVTSWVDSHPKGASPFGALNMAGNVWEWCADWHGLYSRGTQVDPRGPASGVYRVLRGGSWTDHSVNLLAAMRKSHRPAGTSHDLGFRPVLER